MNWAQYQKFFPGKVEPVKEKDIDQNQDAGSETIESISAASNPQQQLRIEIDESKANSCYSSTVRVWGSAEEFHLDFAGGLRPTGPQSAKLVIDQRVTLNPWAAKRLALSLGQAIARYEQTYGPLELDMRKRMVRPPKAQTTPAAPSGKLS